MPSVFSSHEDFKDWFSNPLTNMVEGNVEMDRELVQRLHKVCGICNENLSFILLLGFATFYFAPFEMRSGEAVAPEARGNYLLLTIETTALFIQWVFVQESVSFSLLDD